MKFNLNNKFIVMLAFVLICFLLLGAAKEYKRITNLRVKGWLFGDTSWCGQRSWAKAGTVDTLVVAGIGDGADCYIYLQADSLTCKAPLYVFTVEDDTVFVKCDSSLTTSFDYNWMIIRK